MTLYRAAKRYKISKAALFKHVKGMRGVKRQTFGRPPALPFHEQKKLQCLKLMEKWGFGLSRKEVLETIGRYVNENKIPHHSEEEFLVMIFVRFKGTHKLSLKKPQSIEACRKKSIDPILPVTSHAEGATTLPSTSHAEGAAILPVTSHS
jgi:hypothetical protein